MVLVKEVETPSSLIALINARGAGKSNSLLAVFPTCRFAGVGAEPVSVRHFPLSSFVSGDVH